MPEQRPSNLYFVVLPSCVLVWHPRVAQWRTGETRDTGERLFWGKGDYQKKGVNCFKGWREFLCFCVFSLFVLSSLLFSFLFFLHPRRLTAGTWEYGPPGKRKIIWTKPSFSGFMLIFGGVFVSFFFPPMPPPREINFKQGRPSGGRLRSSDSNEEMNVGRTDDSKAAFQHKKG